MVGPILILDAGCPIRCRRVEEPPEPGLELCRPVAPARAVRQETPMSDDDDTTGHVVRAEVVEKLRSTQRARARDPDLPRRTRAGRPYQRVAGQDRSRRTQGG